MHLLPQFGEIHQHLKTAGLSHQLHIIIPASIESEAHDAKAQMTGLFESITVHPMESEPMEGWPYGPNQFFYAAALTMYRDNKTIPWQLVELDCLPIRANAYDLIAGKYASCGTPFFGNIDKTPWRETEPFLFDANGKATSSLNPRYGKIVPSKDGASDEMMSGCAVYPGNLFDRENFFKGGYGLMADFMKGQESATDAWDVHLRSAMRKDGMTHTPIIAQHWNTENYRMENGRLICDGRESHEIFERNPNWEKRYCGGPVHPDAVMIHGCKDDSLYNLIMSNGIPESYMLPTIVVPAVQTTTASAGLPPAPPTVSDPRLDRLEMMMGKLMEAFGGSIPSAPQNKPSVAPNVAQGELGKPSVEQVASGHETKGAAEPILTRVYEALPDVGKKQMLSSLSKSLSTDKGELKRAIESSGKFVIKGPAEWVERIAA